MLPNFRVSAKGYIHVHYRYYGDYDHYNSERKAPYNIRKWGGALPISFRPMRQFMEDNDISFYRLANEGIDAQILKRMRHDKAVTPGTIGKICKCKSGDLMEYIDDNCESKSTD